MKKVENTKGKKALKGSPPVIFNPEKDAGEEKSQAAATLRPKSSFRNAAQPVVEGVLSITDRRKRSNRMRRLATKLTRLRMFARNQFAPERRLKMRAAKMARNVVRGRFAGARGKNYKNLSVSDKIAVDSMIQNKKKLVKRLSTRLLPMIRKAEFLRLQGVRKHAAPKPIQKAGGLGIMPKPKLDTAHYIQKEADLIAENISYAIFENKTQKLDRLLKAGLADKNQIMQYKRAIEDPDFAKKYSVLRDKAFNVLEKLIDTIVSDTTLYDRARNNIQKNYQFKDSKKK